MRIKTKGIIKKIALVLAGVVALSAVGFGVAKLVEFVKDDLKTINPVFDVGNLGTDGKFVDDESTLYTKEAFECDGLQIKLDFDNQIEYQIYFYDDLDNFVESTEVLSAPYSETVHDGYARIVIMPTNDEDEKISLTERVTYPAQMTIKVAKEQNVEYVTIGNKRLVLIDNVGLLRFHYGIYDEIEDVFVDEVNHIITSSDVLAVKGGDTVSCTYAVSEDLELHLTIFEFKMVNGVCVYTSVKQGIFSEYVLSDDVDCILVQVSVWDSDGAIESYFDNVKDFYQYIHINK